MSVSMFADQAEGDTSEAVEEDPLERERFLQFTKRIQSATGTLLENSLTFPVDETGEFQLVHASMDYASEENLVPVALRGDHEVWEEEDVVEEEDVEVIEEEDFDGSFEERYETSVRFEAASSVRVFRDGAEKVIQNFAWSLVRELGVRDGDVPPELVRDCLDGVCAAFCVQTGGNVDALRSPPTVVSRRVPVITSRLGIQRKQQKRRGPFGKRRKNRRAARKRDRPREIGKNPAARMPRVESKGVRSSPRVKKPTVANKAATPRKAAPTTRATVVNNEATLKKTALAPTTRATVANKTARAKEAPVTRVTRSKILKVLIGPRRGLRGPKKAGKPAKKKPKKVQARKRKRGAKKVGPPSKKRKIGNNVSGKKRRGRPRNVRPWMRDVKLTMRAVVVVEDLVVKYYREH